MKAILFFILLFSFGANAQEQPTLFFGSSKSGETITSAAKLISVRDKVTGEFLTGYKIYNLVMTVDGNSFDSRYTYSPKGFLLTDKMSEVLQVAPSGTMISVMVSILGPDSVARRIAGNFEIE